jgi:hypothetical protein
VKKKSKIKYGIIFSSAFIIEICSTFYIRFTAEANTMGMVFFAFIGPFLALPFAGYMVESKFWNERIRMAFALALGYAIGALVVNNILKK